MHEEKWKSIISRVTNCMKTHCRAFMTPLSTETEVDIKLIGTGTYVAVGSCKHLLTCEHVARTVPVHYRFKGNDSVFELRKRFRMDGRPHDVALVEINENQWSACKHQAEALPYERISDTHNPTTPEELLFFYGWAGENARYGFGVHETIGTGYCSQEIKDSGDEDFFEVFWDPQKTIVQKETVSEDNPRIRIDDPRGFSGSVVWNTRYCEVTGQKRQWSPRDAVVTGILQRWDQKKKSLMVWRSERLKEWIGDAIESWK